MLLPDGSEAVTLTDPSGIQVIHIRPADYWPQPLHRLGFAPFPVLVPHTKAHPETVAPANATWVDVSSSNVAYYAAMFEWWARGETFMVLEHDVACRQDVIDQFDDCPEPWCLFGYSEICHPACMDAWGNSLGCTRFRAELMEAVPDAMRFPRDNWDWHNMCDGLGENLRKAGYTHHFHEPWVHHHRKVQSPEAE